MTPLSEADPEIREGVVRIFGLCRCRQQYRERLRGEASDEYDPECDYHRYGEHFANLLRENRRLRRSLGIVSVWLGNKRGK